MPLTLLRNLILSALVLLLTYSTVFAAANGKSVPTLTVAIHKNSLVGVLGGWPEKGGACTQLLEQMGRPKDRGAAELVIICRAFLANSGMNPHIKLQGVPNHVRSRYLVEIGKADIAAESVWLEQIDLSKVFATQAVLAHEEFEKVPYTLESHPLQITPAKSINLKNYRGVIINTWNHDWYTLTQVSNEVLNAVDLASVYRMLGAGRADYTLLENHSHGESYFVHDDIKLVKVPGVYVVLQGTRHLIISQSSAFGGWAIRYINMGIKKLKKEGKIREIYESAGFLYSAAQGMRKLEPEY